ncbi:DUF2625 domain-containing protein [Mucilaginibacter sp. SD-g]|uniref:DUF2625 domain-containing protein n=1 Tax=Mucilaginibacter segetis TaxID=2793071 RepID=A0A934PUU5_9SPHI|nr:DUF2625 domain-containing protein [Mucilaginibacter segetis]
MCKNSSAQNQLRSIEELTKDTSGWGILKSEVNAANNKCEILPAKVEQAKQALQQTQVTTHSIMGALIYFTGGILIDNGWIRLLGSGSDKLSRSLPGWNKGKTFKEYGESPGYLFIGDDAIGGFFAINGGTLGTDLGNIYYLAPETLKWQSLNMGYYDFFQFCLNGDLNTFYKKYRWKNWEKDISKLNGDKVYNFYPYLWSAEGQDMKKIFRNIVSIEEQYNFNIEAMKKIK